jgi:hypothetical protein
MPSFNFFLSGSLLALAALSSTTYAQAPSNASAPSNTSTGTHPYTLVADYSGSNFFDGFVTFTGADPTHGKVNYTDMAFAAKQGYLAYNFHEQDNVTRARIGVDSVEDAQARGRNSVRLTSKKTFSAGTRICPRHALQFHDPTHRPWLPGRQCHLLFHRPTPRRKRK